MNKTQKIKKIKHGRIILIFITIVFLVLFIGYFSKTLELECKESRRRIVIVDTNEKYIKGVAGFLDLFLKQANLPKNVEFDIKEMKQFLKVKTLVEGCNRIANEMLIEWLLEYYYSKGYQITCGVGDWIILELK